MQEGDERSGQKAEVAAHGGRRQCKEGDEAWGMEAERERVGRRAIAYSTASGPEGSHFESFQRRWERALVTSAPGRR